MLTAGKYKKKKKAEHRTMLVSSVVRNDGLSLFLSKQRPLVDVM